MLVPLPQISAGCGLLYATGWVLNTAWAQCSGGAARTAPHPRAVAAQQVGETQAGRPRCNHAAHGLAGGQAAHVVLRFGEVVPAAHEDEAAVHRRDVPLRAARLACPGMRSALARRAALLRAERGEADARDEFLDDDRELVVRRGRGRAHREDQLPLHDV